MCTVSEVDDTLNRVELRLKDMLYGRRGVGPRRNWYSFRPLGTREDADDSSRLRIGGCLQGSFAVERDGSKSEWAVASTTLSSLLVVQVRQR